MKFNFFSHSSQTFATFLSGSTFINYLPFSHLGPFSCFRMCLCVDVVLMRRDVHLCSHVFAGSLVSLVSFSVFGFGVNTKQMCLCF